MRLKLVPLTNDFIAPVLALCKVDKRPVLKSLL